ncbi:response regulator [Marivirga arenosa]|jgi:CheY-like chemotaxis protein|uniref:Response regulator n=1 Tax=Marivirga arenosa TaxID=3059076 RepID=A0AA49GJ51_9BACT|nr:MULTISPECIES: response regulator [unclassified Marivirga]WKK87715.2 response regulator [Marivirga sp. ABR2-2]WNB18045.1 response regulator [Marivirga sp. BKB1-2]
MSLKNEDFEVLIVDDDDMTVFLHDVHVKETQFHPAPKSFYNGNDVVDYLKTYYNVKKQYCILLDINMPILSGWEVMDAIIENGMDKNIAVIVLTSSINTADKIKSEQYDMVIDYVEKPLSEQRLLELKSEEKFKAFYTE